MSLVFILVFIQPLTQSSLYLHSEFGNLRAIENSHIHRSTLSLEESHSISLGWEPKKQAVFVQAKKKISLKEKGELCTSFILMVFPL